MRPDLSVLSVYVHTPDQCLRLDAATGEKLAAFDVPGEPGIWGYLACQDGTLFGSVADQEHITKWAYQKSDMSKLFSQSKRFFALEAETGALKWFFEPKHSIRHNAIAIGPGRVYLIDRPISEIDRFEYDPEEAKRRGETPKDTITDAELLALDAATGEVVWRVKENVFGTLLALSVEHDVLLMTEQHTRFKLPSEKGGRMTAYRASTGKPIWSGPNDPQGKGSRPILRGDILYDEPGAWGLLDGKRLDFKLDRSYGCGIVAASQNLFVYRSATIGYYDLLRNEGTIDYGGARPACWINAIPAGGLVLIPDATTRCTCSYLIKTTLALKPAEDRP